MSHYGAKNVPLIVSGEVWRLLTPSFLHSGVIHLFLNLLFTLTDGAHYERSWGSLRFVFFFLFSSVSSTLASCVFLPSQLLVGSSGGLCGILGAAAASNLSCCLFPRRDLRAPPPRTPADYFAACSTLSFVLVFFAASFYVTIIDFYAHFFGAVAGFLSGMVVFPLCRAGRLAKALCCFSAAVAIYIFFYVGVEAMRDIDVGELEFLRHICDVESRDIEHVCVCEA